MSLRSPFSFDVYLMRNNVEIGRDKTKPFTSLSTVPSIKRITVVRRKGSMFFDIYISFLFIFRIEIIFFYIFSGHSATKIDLSLYVRRNPFADLERYTGLLPYSHLYSISILREIDSSDPPIIIRDLLVKFISIVIVDSKGFRCRHRIIRSESPNRILRRFCLYDIGTMGYCCNDIGLHLTPDHS